MGEGGVLHETTTQVGFFCFVFLIDGGGGGGVPHFHLWFSLVGPGGYIGCDRSQEQR